MISVLKLQPDGRHLGHCIGPALPAEYRIALDHWPIGENSGSCGAAAHHLAAVYVTDTLVDPLWQNYRTLAFKHHIRSCWSQPILNPGGQLIGVLAATKTQIAEPTAEDCDWLVQYAELAGAIITHSEHEAHLLALKSRLDWATSNTLAGIWDTNLSTGTVTRSPGFMTVLGFDKAEPGTQRSNWRARIHPDDLPRVDAQVNACAQGEKADFEVEYRIRDGHGQWRWLLDRGQRADRDPGSGHTHMRGIYTDITRLKHAEEALANSECRFRDFAFTAADTFWEQDAELKFTWLSDDTKMLIGLPVEEICKKRRGEFVSAEQLATENWQNHLALLATREPFHNFEYQADGPGLSQKFLQISGLPVFDPQGRFVGYRGTARDITEQRRHLQQMTHAANHDHLTGLLNGKEFDKHLRLNCADAHRDHLNRVLCYLDLDKFKQVNDDAGHAAGDTMLKKIADLLGTQIRQNDVLARLGGDEFGLLLRNCPEQMAEQICSKIIVRVNAYRLPWREHTFSVGLSIGMTVFNKDLTPEELLARADAACYEAKRRGRNKIFTYRS